MAVHRIIVVRPRKETRVSEQENTLSVQNLAKYIDVDRLIQELDTSIAKVIEKTVDLDKFTKDFPDVSRKDVITLLIKEIVPKALEKLLQ
jgi:hypothetical protein